MTGNNNLIDVTPSGDVTFVANVSNFLEALNPLGLISQTIGKIIAVRVQMKSLQNDAEEIKREYEAKNKMIDGAMKYAIEQLEMQRIGMEKYFAHAAKQQDLERIYSSQRIRVMEAMTALMKDKNTSLDEKKLAVETIKAMSSDLNLAQQAGTTTLSALVEASNRNLLSVPSLAGLLSAPVNKEKL